jgi:hypothetical protein
VIFSQRVIISLDGISWADTYKPWTAKHVLFAHRFALDIGLLLARQNRLFKLWNGIRYVTNWLGQHPRVNHRNAVFIECQIGS